MTQQVFNGTLFRADASLHVGGRLWSATYDDGDVTKLITEPLRLCHKTIDARLKPPGFTRDAEADEVYLKAGITHAVLSDTYTYTMMVAVERSLDALT